MPLGENGTALMFHPTKMKVNRHFGVIVFNEHFHFSLQTEWVHIFECGEGGGRGRGGNTPSAVWRPKKNIKCQRIRPFKNSFKWPIVMMTLSFEIMIYFGAPIYVKDHNSFYLAHKITYLS